MKQMINRPLAVFIPILGVVAIYWGAHVLYSYWLVTRADQEIQAGYGALASERLEPYREQVTTTERGCSAYLRSNFLTHRMERLQWGSESCLNHKIDNPEIIVAQSAAKEAAGEAQEAVTLLVEAAPRFKDTPLLYMRLFSMMKTAKNLQGMRYAMLKAVDQAPTDPKVLWAALQFFTSQEKWEDAKQMASRLKDLPTANFPDAKFLEARAFLKGGDTGTANALAEQGRTLIATKPELQEQYKKQFPEFFDEPSAPAPNTSAQLASKLGGAALPHSLPQGSRTRQ